MRYNAIRLVFAMLAASTAMASVVWAQENRFYQVTETDSNGPGFREVMPLGVTVDPHADGRYTGTLAHIQINSYAVCKRPGDKHGPWRYASFESGWKITAVPAHNGSMIFHVWTAIPIGPAPSVGQDCYADAPVHEETKDVGAVTLPRGTTINVDAQNGIRFEIKAL